MTPAQFIHAASVVTLKQISTPYFRLAVLGMLYGQPGGKRICYAEDGKWFMKSYNGHVRSAGGEFYDAYHLWSLAGGNLKYLGGNHRL